MRMSKARKACVSAMMKDTIFEAATSVLEQHGVGGMTMDRVATTAELGTASLYTYFRDKDELLQFIYARLVDPFFQAIEEIVNADLPSPQKLERILRAALERPINTRASFDCGGVQSRISRKTPRPAAHAAGFHRRFRAGNPGRLIPSPPSCANGPHASRRFFGVVRDAGGGASKDAVNHYVEVLIDAVRNGFSISLSKIPDSTKEAPGSSNP